MTVYIVTEGQSDADLLKRLMPKELLEGVTIVPAGGLSSVKSLASSLLVRRRKPVAIVIDADSAEPELIQERRQSIEEVIESVAGGVPVKVVVAVPALDSPLPQNAAIAELRAFLRELQERSLAETRISTTA
jgi:predicted ATP-dependent endonuclease of OLD family